jgi:hypothetical protein
VGYWGVGIGGLKVYKKDLLDCRVQPSSFTGESYILFLKLISVLEQYSTFYILH